MGYKLKRILIYPDGVTEKQVRPVGFTPTSNTLAYFPLANDGLDKMGNYTLSNTGTAQTLGRRFTAISQLSAVPSGAKTMLCWVKFNTINTSSVFGQCSFLFGLEHNFNFLVSSTGTTGSKTPCFYLYINPTEYFGGQNLLTTGSWHLIALTKGTALKGYVDGTEYTVYNSGSAGTTTSAFLINLSSNATTDLLASEFIIESKTRTADEIADYYNQTKGNYGL